MQSLFYRSMVSFFSFFILIPALAQQCLTDFKGAGCLVQTETGYGIKKGKKYVIPSYFDTLIQTPGGNILALQHGNRGLFDPNGRMIIPVSFTFIDLSREKDGIFEVARTGKRNVFITRKMEVLNSFVKVNDILLAQRTEVSLLDYLIFVQKAGKSLHDSVSRKDLLPVPGRMEAKSADLLKIFLNSEEYKERIELPSSTFPGHSLSVAAVLKNNKEFIQGLQFPVTGVSFLQTRYYCAWLEKEMKQFFSSRLNADLIVRVRLPEKDEWEEIAVSGLLDVSMQRQQMLDSIDRNGCSNVNYLNKKNCVGTDPVKNRSTGTAWVEDYSPSYIGMYNLFGNVAEMVAERGIAKGGSFAHPAKTASADKNIRYEEPQQWLGFRVIIDFRL